MSSRLEALQNGKGGEALKVEDQMATLPARFSARGSVAPCQRASKRRALRMRPARSGRYIEAFLDSEVCPVYRSAH